jgi:hypothetical protein
MAQRYPHKGSYAAFLVLSASLFVLIMLFLWFWLRERKQAPVHTSNPQSSAVREVDPLREIPSEIRASAPIPA